MDENKERVAIEISKLSRNIFISLFVFLLLGLVSSLVQLKWLAIIFGILFMLLALLSWITPGIFIVFGKPWLAHAWLRGINPLVVSGKQWNQLSVFVKFLIYFWSVLFFLGAVGLAVTMIDSFQK